MISKLVARSISIVYLHELGAFRIGFLITFCLESFCFLSKSFVDSIPITGKTILSTTLLPFLHSMVSNILCGKRIGFITLSKNKITENHGLVREGARSKLCFVYYEVWTEYWLQRKCFLLVWLIRFYYFIWKKNTFDLEFNMYNEETLL